MAQTRHRHRCPQPVLDPHTPQGVWTLLPASPRHGQLALPTGRMAVYDLSHLPYGEQLRWRTQRCPAFSAESARGGLPTRYTFIVNPSSGMIMGEEEVLTKTAGRLNVPVPSVVGYTVYLEAQHTPDQ